MIETELDGGLRLRQATIQDIDQIAKFNGEIHEESEDEKGKIVAWTQDLMSGRHPTTSAKDFLLVETESGEIVSSTCNIPQTWRYEDVELKVGRPELVATASNWRKKGLVRKQFELLHKQSEANGDVMQVITGIPWYYRQFGYSHALDLGGGRQFDFNRPGNNIKVNVEDERFLWRRASTEDIPSLKKYYAIHSQKYLLNSVRDDDIWRFELSDMSPNSIHEKHFWLISYRDNRPAGYIGFVTWPQSTIINEIACEPTQSLREFALFVTRAIGRYIDETNSKTTDNEATKPMSKRLFFNCGREHPAYTALGRQLGEPSTPYAWYVRIPNVPAFLNHIQPVLERRLGNSVLINHTGTFKINLYEEQFLFEIKAGRITNINSYEPKSFRDGDLFFTRPEFIQLVCGHKSFDEINNIHVDCHCRNHEAKVLVDILFPKIPSNAMGVN